MMNFPRGTIINGRFKLLERIGYGSFGVVYKGEDIKNNNSPVALKLEPSSHNNRTRNMLDTEYKAYCKLEGGPGIPKVCYFLPLKLAKVSIKILFCILLVINIL
jgi:serine/threonine protein kinase